MFSKQTKNSIKIHILRRISLDQDQELEGDLWLGNSVVENLDIAGLVNGVDLEDFVRNIMSKTRDQEIMADKIFTGTTVVNGRISTTEGELIQFYSVLVLLYRV